MKVLGHETLVGSSQSICSSLSLLYDFVFGAESDAMRIKEENGGMFQLKSGARKRRRQRTPPEELKSDDRQRFLELEEDVERTARRDKT